MEFLGNKKCFEKKCCLNPLLRSHEVGYCMEKNTLKTLTLPDKC